MNIEGYYSKLVSYMKHVSMIKYNSTINYRKNTNEINYCQNNSISAVNKYQMIVPMKIGLFK